MFILNSIKEEELKENLNFKLKTFNTSDLIGKLVIIREIKGSVIDLVYYNMLRGMKSKFKSEYLKRGKDVITDFSYDIVVGDYALSIPLYDINILRVKYADGVSMVVAPEMVKPIDSKVYDNLELYEGMLKNGLKLKTFMKEYKGGKLKGFFVYVFNKEKATSYIRGKVVVFKKEIDKYYGDISMYDKKMITYKRSLDNISDFLDNIAEDLSYFKEKGFKIDIML